MEILSIKKENFFPPLGLLIGGPKVGKSTLCSSIPNALICDLEGHGYDHIGAEAIVKPQTLEDMKDVLRYYFSDKSKHSLLIVDHLREMTNFYASVIAKKNKVKTIGMIGFGKGNDELRHDMWTMLKEMKRQATLEKRIILVAHSTDRNGQMRLDVDGKIDTMLTSMVDYIGQLYRQGDQTHVTFASKIGSEAGCRNEYLSKYSGLADWKTLLEVAKGGA